jgi:cytochrome c-type biogenesis protein CcmH
VLLAACSKTAAPPPATTSEKVLRGTVDVKPELKANLAATDTVYIIARKGAGGPPLAVKRVTDPKFPLSFELTEKDVMMGGPFDGDVELTVRVDKDGDAMTKNPGDLVGKGPAGTKVGQTSVNVLIDQTL